MGLLVFLKAITNFGDRVGDNSLTRKHV